MNLRNHFQLLMMFAVACVVVGCKDDSSNDNSNPSSSTGQNQNATETDSQPEAVQPMRSGYYYATLESPGGELFFGLTIDRNESDESGEARSLIHNGPETIEVPHTMVSGNEITIEFPHYDSVITGTCVNDRIRGTWKKRVGDEKWTEMAFRATYFADEKPSRADEDLGPYLGRWSVQFSKTEDAAIGVFEVDEENGFVGTFQTTIGDYRYLSAEVGEYGIWMSCFDGAHAFLFYAMLANDKLKGEFWSRDAWYETWTATRADDAVLADGFSQTTWNDEVSLESLVYPDLDGMDRSLADDEFSGAARILHVFGSWCPNCHDAGEYLSELQAKYGERGLRIQGLAFELTSDVERNVEQVRRYLERHEMDYPVLLVGPSDKEKASERFPLIDRVRSYPTTIFLDRNNQVKAVHTGFSGPATGATHEALKARFEEIVEELLAESDTAN